VFILTFVGVARIILLCLLLQISMLQYILAW